MKDYYKTLGIDKSASKEDIKKAFHKLAHQFHPDKNKNDPSAAQKFKEASEAYTVLSDDTKRQQYDTFGSSGVGGPGAGGFNGSGFDPRGFGGFDFSGFQQADGGVEFDLGDIFGDFFGGGRTRRGREQRGQDISVDLTIPFDEAIFGTEKDIVVTKASKCQTCNGSGAAANSGQETCKTCHGKGKVTEARRTLMGVFQSSRVCETCHGSGQIPKVPCATCRGTGVTERRQEISVVIPVGIENGQMIRLTGMGEAVPFGVSGDLYVKIHVTPHSSVRKEGDNLVTELEVKLTEALMGAELTLQTLEGDLILKIPEGTNNGDILRVAGKGVPTNRNRRGDLLVKIHVKMPKKLSKSARQIVEELGNEGL